MASKQKVLVLLPLFDLGGAEKQGVYIARSMQESGKYEVEVWAIGKGTGKLCVLLDDLGLKYKCLNKSFDSFYNVKSRIKLYFNFRYSIQKSKIEILIPFTYHCNVLAASTFRFSRVKKCVWFQIAMEYQFSYSSFEKIASKFKPVYAANSLAAAKFISEKHKIELSSVSFIPNPFEFISPKESRNSWREKLNIKSDELMFFIAANFYPEKDHETLLNGFSKAKKKHKNAKLVLAGSKEYLPALNNLKALSFDLSLSFEDVLFIGTSDDVPGLIEASDICFLTSISEGSPNALIEYMGYGKPIIASSIPPIVELLNSSYPYLFEKGNSDDLALKIDLLISEINFPKVHDLTEVNREKILTQYTIESNFNAFHKIISQ